MLDKRLFDLLVCPVCKNKIIYKKDRQELVCRIDKLAFPIRDGIPIMLEQEARIILDLEQEE